MRLSEGYLDKLYMTFVALRQGEDTYLVIAADLVGIYESFSEPICEKISAVTGIPENRILLNSTHTHSSVPAHVEMMGLIGMGSGPMVGATAPSKIYLIQKRTTHASSSFFDFSLCSFLKKGTEKLPSARLFQFLK